MKDIYQTISGSSKGEFKNKGSKFLAYAFPANSESEWQMHLEAVKKAHPKARHYCYAYRLGLDENNFRTNDDGEPSGTAGKPILGRIDSFGLTNIIIIVVRYFGGTLLGASGLINAYKLSAAAALENAEIIEKTVEVVYQLTFDYALMSEVMNAIKKYNLEMIHQNFGSIGKVQIAIRKSAAPTTLIHLKAAIAKVHLAMAKDLEKIEGLTIDYLGERG